MHKAIVCPTGFRATLAALFVLNYWLRGFPLYTIEDRFELRCQANATDFIVLQNLFLLAVIRVSFGCFSPISFSLFGFEQNFDNYSRLPHLCKIWQL